MKDKQTVFEDNGNVTLPVSEDKISIYEAANCTFDNLPETWSGELFAYPSYKLSERYAQEVTKMIYLYNSGDMSDIILVLPADLSATWWGELSSYAQCWCLTYDNSHRENVAVFLLTHRKDYARRFIDNFTKIGEVYICSHKQVNELICAS